MAAAMVQGSKDLQGSVLGYMWVGGNYNRAVQ